MAENGITGTEKSQRPDNQTTTEETGRDNSGEKVKDKK